MTILLVDDDPTTGEIVSKVLTNDGHKVHSYSEARSALENFPDSLDLVISDFYMPGMNGAEFYDKVRSFNQDVPFIYLTSEDSTTVAVELMRRGASDLIQKPIQPDTLRLRIERVMQDARHRRVIRRILEEETLVRTENQRLVNWRILYAGKDTRKTRELIDNLSRNINQSGGFSWVGLLRDMVEEYDGDRYLVPKSVLDLAIRSAEQHEHLIQRITEIGMLNADEAVQQRVPVSSVTDFLEELVTKELTPLADRYNRAIALERTKPSVVRDESTTMAWDTEVMGQVLHELTCNAIKYSPSEIPLYIGWEVSENEPNCADRCFIIRYKNRAISSQTRDGKGEPITGVPYEYRESVFELFFTVESFPRTIPE